jgi:hypothetical protein
MMTMMKEFNNFNKYLSYVKVAQSIIYSQICIH